MQIVRAPRKVWLAADSDGSVYMHFKHVCPTWSPEEGVWAVNDTPYRELLWVGRIGDFVELGLTTEQPIEVNLAVL